MEASRIFFPARMHFPIVKTMSSPRIKSASFSCQVKQKFGWLRKCETIRDTVEFGHCGGLRKIKKF